MTKQKLTSFTSFKQIYTVVIFSLKKFPTYFYLDPSQCFTGSKKYCSDNEVCVFYDPPNGEMEHECRTLTPEYVEANSKLIYLKIVSLLYSLFLKRTCFYLPKKKDLYFKI